MQNIVVLGGGFGGLQTAKRLGRQIDKLNLNGKYKVTLVDRHSYHIFTPLLYEIATTSRDTAEYEELKSLVTWDFENLLAGLDSVYCKEGEVEYVDLEKKVVHMKGSQMEYDYLVVALGAETNYFDIPGLEENALKLKTFDDAVAIRNKVMFEVEERKSDDRVRVVIGGGGSTGVEMAGEIKEWGCELEEEGVCRVDVKLLEGADRILSGFDDKVARLAKRRLKNLGVEVETNSKVVEAGKSKVFLENGHSVHYDVLIWAGGVEASSLVDKMPVNTGEQDRVKVFGALQCVPHGEDLKVFENVYAVGDIACFYDQRTGEPVPQMARIAMMQGRVAARNILEKIKTEAGLKSKPGTYTYKHKNYPYIVPVGGKYALSKVGSMVISGLPAWVFKGLVELNYFVSILPFWQAVRVWLKGLKIFVQNDRLG